MKLRKTLIITVLLLNLLSGCAGQKHSLHLILCSSTLDSGQIPVLSEALTELLPQISTDGVVSSFSHIIMGSGETQDAKLQDAIGQSQFAAMITAQEIDIILCTLDEDDMLAKTDSFMALEKIFTAKELSELAERVIVYETGPKAYGVMLTDNEALAAVFGDVPVGIFLADNCPNPELAKEVMRNLVLG